MPVTTSFDLEALLVPIPGASPSGPDLRVIVGEDSTYFAIKDLRSAARAAERAGDQGPVISPSEVALWTPLVEKAVDALAFRSKDLEIAAWLVEGLARTRGFGGIRDGFRMMRGLVEEFWDALHPMPDEEGVATRVAALTGLNGSGKGGTLIAPIARVPLTSPTSVREVATWDWKRSTAAGTQPDSHSKAGSDGEQLTIQTILESSARETPDEFFRATIAEVDGALEELQALGAALEQRCGGASPPGYAIQEALSEARLALGSLSADRVLSEVDSAPGAPNGESPVEAATLDRAAPTSDGVSRREDAFRQMLALADFFRRTEPHSPIPFLLERAVRWGKMPLPGLLLELIPDGAARETYAKLTGVPGGPSDGSQG